MQDFQPYYGVLAAFPAILLSLYNWYTLRQGGRVKPLNIVNYGLWSVKRDQRNVKHLFLPIILDNEAIKPALVTDISISFSNSSETKDLRINKRIELDMPPGSMSGLGINDFKLKFTKELVPFYPISVPGLQGVMVMLECLDQGEIIELDKELTCTIKVEYGNKKENDIKFPFTIKSEDFEKGLDKIIWLKP